MGSLLSAAQINAAAPTAAEFAKVSQVVTRVNSGDYSQLSTMSDQDYLAIFALTAKITVYAFHPEASDGLALGACMSSQTNQADNGKTVTFADDCKTEDGKGGMTKGRKKLPKPLTNSQVCKRIKNGYAVGYQDMPGSKQAQADAVARANSAAIEAQADCSDDGVVADEDADS